MGRSPSGGAIQVFPIHFDVPGHALPLSTFVDTSLQTEGVIRALSNEIFEGQLQFEIVVLPPSEGSFLTRLGVVLLAGWGMVWTFTESDIGQAFIKGLTGNEPAHWAENAGAALRKSVAGDDDQEVQREAAGVIVCEATKAFLSTPNSELKRAGISEAQFRNAYEAKNNFYESCEAVPRLAGVGFEERPQFPIKRDDFPRYQSVLPPKEDDPDQPWFAAVTQLRVTSPNWDREDRARNWKAKDYHGRDRYFRIEDEEFWQRVAMNAIDAHVIDSIKVQWAYQGRPEQPKNCRVLRVLEYNGTVLARPLAEDALLAMLGNLAQSPPEHPDLFSIERYEG